MKKKQLITLIVAAVLLGAIYWWQNSTRSSDWYGGEGAVSELIMPDFQFEKVYSVRLEKANETLTLQRGEKNWGLQERYGYPIDQSSLQTLFMDLLETKVAQRLTLNQDQLEELGLTQNAVLMKMLDKDGKQLGQLRFGRKHERESEMPPMPYGGGGNVPLGRFMELEDGSYILAANTFSRVDDGMTQWLDKEFFKISDIKKASLRQAGELLWEVTRDSAGADLGLVGEVPEDKEIDSTKLNAIKNAFSWIRFNDVADPAADAASIGMDQAKTLQIIDFDDFVYTMQIAALKDGKQHLQVAVSWQGETERRPGEDETPEDKARLDNEFAAKVRGHQEKGKELKDRLSGWTYIVGASSLDSVNIARDDFFKDKPEPAEAAEADEAAKED
ncbi:MAG: DUF4340 domain-containing protein [Oligosphaeraceae bacterium]|nr:DUF4340 domain-containing protein [Oligosphaeraceae bacterium]